MLKNNIIECIGNTPLLAIPNTNIFAKLEYFNPLHSIKDRAALYMIQGAEQRGELKKGGTIIEATSGNTGIGLAYIGKQKGYRVILTMPESMSLERRKLLSALGGELVLTPASEGMVGAVKRAKELKASIYGAYIPDQFSNEDGAKAHQETTAQEIINDMRGKNVDYLVAVFGSAGTLTGLTCAFKQVYPAIKIIAIEPAESPILTKGYAGAHKIQGIGANFIPSLLNRGSIDEVLDIPSDLALSTARYAIANYGTLVGISSGAALAGARIIASRYPTANIVTVFPDTAERYISSELFE